jgi:hypothetical protein
MACVPASEQRDFRGQRNPLHARHGVDLRSSLSYNVASSGLPEYRSAGITRLVVMRPSESNPRGVRSYRELNGVHCFEVPNSTVGKGVRQCSRRAKTSADLQLAIGGTDGRFLTPWPHGLPSPRSRPMDRPRSRFATFKHAMSSTRLTAARSTPSVVRRFRTGVILTSLPSDL